MPLVGNRRATIIVLLVLTLFLVTFKQIEEVKAQDTIYIRSDGSVEGTDKIQRDGIVYVFTDNISGSIIIERDNVVVNGVPF